MPKRGAEVFVIAFDARHRYRPGSATARPWLYGIASHVLSRRRRAERRCVELARAEVLNPELVRYLNRLSDLLFVMSRAANAGAGIADVPWQQ